MITTNPIWVVNTRLKLQSTKINEGVTYKGMLHGLVKVKYSTTPNNSS